MAARAAAAGTPWRRRCRCAVAERLRRRAAEDARRARVRAAPRRSRVRAGRGRPMPRAAHAGGSADAAAHAGAERGERRSAAASVEPARSALLQPDASRRRSRASVLPTQRFLLAKGAFIDCTLETAIDSTLPGMTTCITATDTFSADGSVVLLERGTKLVGETRGEVAAGHRAHLRALDRGAHADRRRGAACLPGNR